MALLTIDGRLYREMILAGASVLEKNRAGVDALNVFPVPDGDTGTNMSLTMIAAAREVSQMDTPSLAEVADAAARGALKGARGNSGVILSQLLRGFAKGVDKRAEVSAHEFAECLKAGSDMAYKAMMKPREGTILTVARVVAEEMLAKMRRNTPIEKLMGEMIASGEIILRKTPDMLPVLKQAGVVDSGGKGLLLIYVGYKMAVDGEEVELDAAFDYAPADFSGIAFSEEGSEEFVYCTEFFVKEVQGDYEAAADTLREHLMKIGDCVLVVPGEDLLKVHVHSNHPGTVLEHALELGMLSGLKIDNMREQHNTIIDEAKVFDEPAKAAYGCVAVSPGEGISQVFTDLGVTQIVSGGQTMNPSIQEILSAVQKANAQSVIILPNNSNIILAAQQAAEVCEDTKVYVVPTKTVAQGMAALLAFMPDETAENNYSAMCGAFGDVLSGEVTYAVRDSEFGGLTMKEGDILGINDDGICVVGSDVTEVLLDTLSKMVNEESGVITAFYGDAVSEQAAQAADERIQERFSMCDVEVLPGGQSVHYYLFSVE